MTDISLNPAQKTAVEHGEGPLLIIAGAGTGKTRVITERICWLIEQGIAKPENILALTFTHKAAEEMEIRVDQRMPYGYTPVEIATFHSFCDTILRQEAIYIGLDPAYVLMSGALEYVYFRSKLFELSLDRFRPHGNPTKFIEAVLDHFSRLGDEDVSPAAYEEFLNQRGNGTPTNKEVRIKNEGKKRGKSEGGVAETGGILSAERLADYEELARVYREYADMKEKESRFGFSDLVPLTLRLFREKPAVLKRYQEQYRFILVDEFQDTNFAQNELVKLLAGPKGNVTVVGDDDQSIYKFRGAAISNILDFKKTYPKYAKVVLKENYRCNQDILDAAYLLISNNNPYRLEITEKIDKKLVSARSSGASPKKSTAGSGQLACLPRQRRGLSKASVRAIHERSDVAEAESVAQEIERLVVTDKRYSFSDIALLVRANDHADEFIQSFRYHGIPFRYLGQKGLYDRPEVKDMISVLRVLLDYSDNISMFRLLTLGGARVTPREYVEVQRLARSQHRSVFELLEELFDQSLGGRDTKTKPAGKQADTNTQNASTKKNTEAPVMSLKVAADRIFSKDSMTWIHQLLGLLDTAFGQMSSSASVGQILFDFVDGAGYLKHIQQQSTSEFEVRGKNLGIFFESLRRFERESKDAGVASYMQYLDYALESGESPQLEQDQVVEFDAVNVSTIHGAKGLEFPVVFLGNLVSDRFPTRRRSETLPIPDGLIKEKLPEGDAHVQEERRLCYVGMTRAKDLLYLTSAEYYAKGVRRKRQSIFLQELKLVSRDTTESQERDLQRTVHHGATSDTEISVDLHHIVQEKVDRALSYSDLDSYHACPYQFYFARVLGIPGLPSAARSFGLTMHNTMKEFYSRLQRAKRDRGEVEKLPDLEDLLDIYEAKWQSEGYESRMQENRRYRSGKAALTQYYGKFYSENEHPIWLEKRIIVDIGNSRLHGVIDRLDEHADGLEIIDYKTGNIKDRSDDLQLPIYALAVEQELKRPVVSVSYLFLEHAEKVTKPVTPAMKNNLETMVDKTVGEILEMKFPPKPSMLCRFCDYRGICDSASIH